MREIYFAGVLSLIIIAVSGLFVGMVLRTAGLRRAAALRSRRVARRAGRLSLVRELGPSLRLAVRKPRRQRDHRGDRPDEGDRAALGDGDDGGRSACRVVAPRFWGGVISMPLLAALFSMMGIFGAYLVGVRLIDIDAGRSGQHEGGVDFRYDIVNGIIKSVVFGVAVSMIAVFEGFDAIRRPRACRAPRRAPSSRARSRSSRSTSCSTVFMFRGIA
jgi:phospholipid/cholesterol/gamma-HCH transport system permease protein